MTDAEAVARAKAELRTRIRAARRGRGPQQRAWVADALAQRVLALPEVVALTGTGTGDAAGAGAGAVAGAEPVAGAVAGAGAVAAYASYRAEPGTGPLLDALRAAGIRVLLPLVVGPETLAWADYGGPATLAAFDRGIPEPVGPRLPGEGAEALLAAHTRVVLVPATALDADGRRLGQGGGYYDRLCAALPSDPRARPLLVALVHDDEVLPAGEVPTDRHDLAVDVVVTERRTLRTR